MPDSIYKIISLLLLTTLVIPAWTNAANDETQANAYDSGWQSLWVPHAMRLLSTSGKTPGLVIFIGDSITHFNYNAIWPQSGQGKTPEDVSILTWTHAGDVGTGTSDPTSDSGWYLSTASTSTNRGMTASAGLDSAQLLSGSGFTGTSMPLATDQTSARTLVANGQVYIYNLNIGTVAAAFARAQCAVLEIGTNDVNSGRSSSDYLANITAMVGILEAKSIVPILCTLPPRPDNYTNGLIISYNSVLRGFAQSHGLAIIDFNAEILMRRPGTTWQGTLINAGDVHPTHQGAGYTCQSDPYADGGDPTTHTTGAACLNVGFLLRSWLMVQKLKQVKALVIDSAIPSFGTNGWLNYCHDANRTSVSDGRAMPPLVFDWQYQPLPPPGRRLQFTTHAIASSGGLFVGWAANDPNPNTNAIMPGSTGMDRVSLTGQSVWSYDSIANGPLGSSRNLGHWPTASAHDIWVVDDGLFRWPFSTPTRLLPLSPGDALAVWGEATWSNGKLYAMNGLHAEGAGIELGCWNEDSSTAWASVLTFAGTNQYNVGDATEGLAVDGTSLIYAPQYRFIPGQAPPFGMGIYVVNATSGALQYVIGVAPLSRISAANGHMYLVESVANQQFLTARRESDGSLLWRQGLSAISRQAPVIFSDAIVTATSTSINAYDPSSGILRWSTPLVGAQIGDETFPSVPGPSAVSWSPLVRGAVVNGYQTFQVRPSTSIAGCSYTSNAMTVNSLLITSGATITIIDAASGVIRSQFTATGPNGPVGLVRDPIIVGNHVYLMTSQNSVVSYTSN